MLANPSVDLLESRSITLEQLRGLGVRPYDCKVRRGSLSQALVRVRVAFRAVQARAMQGMVLAGCAVQLTMSLEISRGVDLWLC